MPSICRQNSVGVAKRRVRLSMTSRVLVVRVVVGAVVHDKNTLVTGVRDRIQADGPAISADELIASVRQLMLLQFSGSDDDLQLSGGRPTYVTNASGDLRMACSCR